MALVTSIPRWAIHSGAGLGDPSQLRVFRDLEIILFICVCCLIQGKSNPKVVFQEKSGSFSKKSGRLKSPEMLFSSGTNCAAFNLVSANSHEMLSSYTFLHYSFVVWYESSSFNFKELGSKTENFKICLLQVALLKHTFRNFCGNT